MFKKFSGSTERQSVKGMGMMQMFNGRTGILAGQLFKF